MSTVQAIENFYKEEQIVGHYINGQVITESSRIQEIYNPATGKVIRHVALASKILLIRESCYCSS